MFCPKCKALMLPKGDMFACNRCGYEKKKKGKGIVVMAEQKEREVVVLEDNKDDVLPKTRIECPKCGNMEAYWILRQTRSSDEPETQIYTCTKCKHNWRAY